MRENRSHILITGGARSGKSEYAEKRALALSSTPVYLSTCDIYDDEMRARIKTHQARRGRNWHHIHAPLKLVEALKESDGEIRLVDCLTLWVNNLIFHEQDFDQEIEKLLKALEAQGTSVIFVTNEIGMGVVPENELARKFRDRAGLLNQQLAKAVNEIELVISGYPIKVK